MGFHLLLPIIVSVSPVSRLKSLVDTLQTARISFHETVFYSETGMKREFEGVVYYKKGRGLRLDFSRPDNQVILLSDSNYIIWNKRKNRLFKRDIGFPLPRTGDELTQKFDVSYSHKGDTLIFTISSREGQDKVIIGFDKHRFRPLFLLLPGDGSRSFYRLEDVAVNIWLSDSIFKVEGEP